MFRRFAKDVCGNFAVVTAIALVPLMAAVAGAVDYYGTTNKAAEMQNALDASGIAIATQYYSGKTDDELRAYGEKHFRAQVGEDKRIGVDWAYSPDPLVDGSKQSYSAKEATIAVSANLSFKGMLGESWKAQRESKVQIKPGKPACVLALDPTASAAVKIQGSTVVDLNGCVITSNSKASNAVSRDGSAQLSAECVLAVGGTYGLSPSSLVDLDCGEPLTHQYPTPDPLAGVVPPDYTPCQNVPGGPTKTIGPSTPGGVATYCNEKISGVVTLLPGSHVLKGGRIDLGGNGELIGSEVTIFLMDGARISFNGNELVQLTPPTSGPYAGITIYQEKSNTNPIVVNGTSGSSLTGFIYAPGSNIQYSGTSNTAGQDVCIRVVGRTVEMSGTSNFKNDCTVELGGRVMFAGRYITIVR